MQQTIETLTNERRRHNGEENKRKDCLSFCLAFAFITAREREKSFRNKKAIPCM